jgi:hypothetical protein
MRNVVALLFILAFGGGVYLLISSGETVDPATSLVADLDAIRNDQKVSAAQAAEQKVASVSDLPEPSKEGPWPDAHAEELSFTFGRMQVGTRKSHTFVISNNGEADLILKAGTTTCKCTQFGFDPDPDLEKKSVVVKPGESVDLYMTWKAGDNPDRGFRHGGDVHTNDPENPLLKFVVEGSIDMPLVLLPSFWSVGDMYQDQPGKFRGAVASRVFEEFAIKSITSPSGKVKVTAEPMAAEERVQDGYLCGYVLNAEVSTDIPTGIFQEELQIEVSTLDTPLLITLTARKQGHIRLQQMPGTIFSSEKQMLQLGSFSASEGREAKMLLIVDQKGMSEPFQFTRSENDPPFLAAELTPLGQPSGTVHRYIVTFRIPPGKPHTQRTEARPGKILLTTNHPSGEQVNLQLLMYSH